MEVYVDVPFFVIPLLTIVVCAIVTLVVQLAAKGDGRTVSIVISVPIALVGAFLAFHWDKIGVWTIDEWIRLTAAASIIVMSFFIVLLGVGVGEAVYGVIEKKTEPEWFKDDEAAAIAAISREKDTAKLHIAASDAKSYRVRSIANEKLGRHQGAQYEIALHDPDEAACLAALDAVDWDGWDSLLAGIAMRSDKEAVALKALGKIRESRVLADIAARAKNERVAEKALESLGDDGLADVVAKASDTQLAMKALGGISSADCLRKIGAQTGSGAPGAPIRFEAGRRLGDAKICAVALNDAVAADVKDATALLGSVEDADLLGEILTAWFGDAGNAKAAEALASKAITQPTIGKDLEEYCCPDGRLHDLESHIVYEHAGSDHFCGVVTCKNCGYTYEVDEHTYRYKNYKLGCADKQVRCKPGGYLCASCRVAVQLEGSSPAPCVCPTCGAEQHDWEHVNGEIVHRDYSSGTSYDVCKRCGKQDNIINHGDW